MGGILGAVAIYYNPLPGSRGCPDYHRPNWSVGGSPYSMKVLLIAPQLDPSAACHPPGGMHSAHVQGPGGHGSLKWRKGYGWAGSIGYLSRQLSM